MKDRDSSNLFVMGGIALLFLWAMLRPNLIALFIISAGVIAGAVLANNDLTEKAALATEDHRPMEEIMESRESARNRAVLEKNFFYTYYRRPGVDATDLNGTLVIGSVASGMGTAIALSFVAFFIFSFICWVLAADKSQTPTIEEMNGYWNLSVLCGIVCATIAFIVLQAACGYWYPLLGWVFVGFIWWIILKNLKGQAAWVVKRSFLGPPVTLKEAWTGFR